MNTLTRGPINLEDAMPLQHQSDALDTENKDSVLNTVKGAAGALNTAQPASRRTAAAGLRTPAARAGPVADGPALGHVRKVPGDVRTVPARGVRRASLRADDATSPTGPALFEASRAARPSFVWRTRRRPPLG